MKILDRESYKRLAHFDYFRSLAYPYVGVTAEVEVTELLSVCRERKRSFYLAFLHAATLAAEEVPELRQRIHDGWIVEYEECPSSHVELLEDGTYCYCTLRHHMDAETYFALAAKKREECRRGASLAEDENVESEIFISALPWISYTALIQPAAGGEESNPRITWGKYEQNDEGRTRMPVSLLAHHALVDGVHIAAFYTALEGQMAALTRALRESTPEA